MHVMFTSKVLPPVCAEEKDSKSVLRPAQPSYTSTPPQTSEDFLWLILHQTGIPAGS